MDLHTRACTDLPLCDRRDEELTVHVNEGHEMATGDLYFFLAYALL